MCLFHITSWTSCVVTGRVSVKIHRTSEKSRVKAGMKPQKPQIRTMDQDHGSDSCSITWQRHVCFLDLSQVKCRQHLFSTFMEKLSETVWLDSAGPTGKCKQLLFQSLFGFCQRPGDNLVKPSGLSRGASQDTVWVWMETVCLVRRKVP